MQSGPDSRRRIDVWMSMAEHFLDTENRSEIPCTATLCVRSGYTIDEARDIWCYEVTPAVSFNLRVMPGGEWGCWDEEWLVKRVQARRRASRSRPGRLSRWLYRVRVDGNHGVWVAIERCMSTLLCVKPEERDELSRDLAELARRYFDSWSPGTDDRTRWTPELRDTLFHVLEPATLSGELEAARTRVEQAISTASASS